MSLLLKTSVPRMWGRIGRVMRRSLSAVTVGVSFP